MADAGGIGDSVNATDSFAAEELNEAVRKEHRSSALFRRAKAMALHAQQMMRFSQAANTPAPMTSASAPPPPEQPPPAAAPVEQPPPAAAPVPSEGAGAAGSTSAPAVKVDQPVDADAQEEEGEDNG